eukprot:ctg_2337.g585
MALGRDARVLFLALRGGDDVAIEQSGVGRREHRRAGKKTDGYPLLGGGSACGRRGGDGDIQTAARRARRRAAGDAGVGASGERQRLVRDPRRRGGLSHLPHLFCRRVRSATPHPVRVVWRRDRRGGVGAYARRQRDHQGGARERRGGGAGSPGGSHCASERGGVLLTASARAAAERATVIGVHADADGAVQDGGVRDHRRVESDPRAEDAGSDGDGAGARRRPVAVRLVAG